MAIDVLLNRLIHRFLPPYISARTELRLKNLTLALGLLSAIAIIFDLYPLTMFISFPFCLIWIYCAWLHNEPQLKWLNFVFVMIYLYGIGRNFIALV